MSPVLISSVLIRTSLTDIAQLAVEQEKVGEKQPFTYVKISQRKLLADGMGSNPTTSISS
jgi:hypothetical protein